MEKNIYDNLGNRNDRAVWLSTPAHGYLKVLISGVLHSGFKPSKYSYKFLDYVYLEEDCDAPDYLKALHGDEWIEHLHKIPEEYRDEDKPL